MRENKKKERTLPKHKKQKEKKKNEQLDYPAVLQRHITRPGSLEPVDQFGQFLRGGLPGLVVCGRVRQHVEQPCLRVLRRSCVCGGCGCGWEAGIRCCDDSGCCGRMGMGMGYARGIVARGRVGVGQFSHVVAYVAAVARPDEHVPAGGVV